MTAIYLYIIHAACCFTLAVVLWFCSPGRSELLSYYVRYLRTLAALFFLQVPADVILVLATQSGVADAVWPLFLPIFNVAQIALVFSLLHTVLHTPYSVRRLPRITLIVFALVCLVYPLAFAQCRLSDSLPFSMEGLIAFSRMPVSVVLGYTVNVLEAVFVVCCLCGSVRLSRVFLQVFRNFGRRFDSYPVMLLIFLVALAVSSLLGQGTQPGFYHVGLLIWLFFDIWMAVYTLKNRDEFIRVERDSLFIQTEMELARLQKQPSSPEGMRFRRERSVVVRALEDWSTRPDKPYRKEDLTLVDVSAAVGIPPAVLKYYGTASFGLTFEEYIAYLRKKENAHPEVNPV